MFKKMDKTAFKERMYRFLHLVNIEKDLPEFWEHKSKKIKKWYIDQKQADDLVISASPFFLLSPICKHLGILQPIASLVDPKTGKYTGLNCHGAEKLRRFNALQGNPQIKKFYSDSYSDTPLALAAKEAYYVKGNKITRWETPNKR
jgi:phosphoserine phosphatase